jgi:hypothetical protein
MNGVDRAAPMRVRRETWIPGLVDVILVSSCDPPHQDKLGMKRAFTPWAFLLTP